MLLYLIDGYNLLFRIVRQDPIELATSRRALLETLDKLADELALDVTVVFDSAWEEDLIPTHLGALRIIFAPRTMGADKLLLELIEDGNPSSICLVTSDKPLTRLAKAQGASSMTIDEFRHVMFKRKRKKTHTKSINQPQPPKAQFELRIDKTPGSLSFYLEEFEKRLKNSI
jgi:Protein of unknown function (DUF901).